MVAGIVGFVIGAIFGVVMICCFVVASEADDREDVVFNENKLREKENNKADSE